MKKQLYLLSTLAALLLLPGCMGYRLGGGHPAGIDTVTMSPVINKTTEPAIELQITQALRERIQFDGRLKLRDSGSPADGIIDVTLTQYDMQPIAFTGENRSTPLLYRIRITGVAVLKDGVSGAEISTSHTYGEATFPYKSDLTTAKRDALPVAAAEIAKYMVDDLVEQW